MEPRVIKLELTPFDLEMIRVALQFLKANLDDYNDMQSEAEEPTLTEDDVTAVLRRHFLRRKKWLRFITLNSQYLDCIIRDSQNGRKNMIWLPMFLHEDLEKAFALTTHIDCPWWENKGTITYKKSRSTSVGDVIVTYDGTFLV